MSQQPRRPLSARTGTTGTSSNSFSSRTGSLAKPVASSGIKAPHPPNPMPTSETITTTTSRSHRSSPPKEQLNDYTLLSSPTALYATTGRQRVIMKQADEMRIARQQAYASMQNGIRELQQGLTKIENSLTGDNNESNNKNRNNNNHQHRLFEVDQVMSRRQAIREILEATNNIAARRPPGLESSSSSSSGNGSDDDDDDGNTAGEKENDKNAETKSKMDSSLLSGSFNHNHHQQQAARNPVIHADIQEKANDGVDVAAIFGAVKAVNKAEGKSIPASNVHLAANQNQQSQNQQNQQQGKRAVSFSFGHHHHQNVKDELSIATPNNNNNNNSSLRREISGIPSLPQGIDLEASNDGDDDDMIDSDDDNDDDDEATKAEKEKKRRKSFLQDENDHAAMGITEDDKDVDGMTADEVKARFTQPVQDALDFFAVSCERVAKDISDQRLDPPLRVETAQGKFFTIGRQYADIASRMIETIDACRLISEKSLKLVQPLLAKGSNHGVASIAHLIASSSPAAAATLAAVGMNTSALEANHHHHHKQVAVDPSILSKFNKNNNNDEDEAALLEHFRKEAIMNDPENAHISNILLSSSPNRTQSNMMSATNNENFNATQKKKSTASSSSASVLDPRVAMELVEQVESEKQRFANFRHLAKQLTSVIGGLNRCDLDARDLLDDLSQRDMLMASERAKMNVAKEECTSVTAVKDELKSELWLHRASNKMRQAIRRKAERIREKKAAQALLLANSLGIEDEQAALDKELEERNRQETLEKLLRNPVPLGVGSPAMASVGSSRVVGPLTIVHVALDRYPEMWAAAPAAATKTLQMYREAIHASLWYAARMSIDAAKLKAYKEAREELIKKYKDANEPFTEEDEKIVKPKQLSPVAEIFAEQIQLIVRAAAPLLQATTAMGETATKVQSSLEWSKRFSGRKIGSELAASLSGSPGTPGSKNPDAAGYSPAAFAAQARKRGESPYQPQKTPAVFSHEAFPYRSLLGLPGEKVLETLNNGTLIVMNQKENNKKNGNNNNSYMNLGPPPVVLLAEGDGSLPGSGDGGYTMVAFNDPDVAISWMCGVQILLSQLPWPNGVMNAEIVSDRSDNGRERVFPMLNRFDDSVRERMAAAEVQANSSGPSLLQKSGMQQLEEDAAFIAFSRRFGLQQDESGSAGSREFDPEPWKQIAILLSREWGCGDQRFPGALFRGPLVRMGAHIGSVPFEELRQIESAKIAPYYLDPMRRCATIPAGATPAVASWLCHQARGGEILISDALSLEVKDTLKREAIFHRRVPLPASARDFFVNASAATNENSKLEVIEPVSKSEKDKQSRSARRRSTLSASTGRRGSLSNSISVSVSVGSKTAIEQVQKKEIYLSSTSTPSQASEADCAVQLFPPVLLERGLVLGTPTSATAKSNTYVARVTCYNPNWWLWLNTTPLPFIPRAGDLEIQAKRKNPLLEAMGWTHAETIQMQRQELYKCAKLMDQSRRAAAVALREQRLAMDVAAFSEMKMMEQEDKSPFADALGILRTANADGSFSKFYLWTKKYQHALENKIRVPAMHILPPQLQQQQQQQQQQQPTLASFAGSFRFGSFASKKQNINDFESSNIVTPYVLSNVVLQAVIHRIQVLKEEHAINLRIETENMRTYDPSGQQQPKHDKSSFAKWYKKAEADSNERDHQAVSSVLSSVSAAAQKKDKEYQQRYAVFAFQLLCRVIDGLYEECFTTILQQLDSSTSILLNVPKKHSSSSSNNNKKKGDDDSDSENNSSNDDDGKSSSSSSSSNNNNNNPPKTIGSLYNPKTKLMKNNINEGEDGIVHHHQEKNCTSLRPDQLHNRFCGELLRCVNHLDSVFKVPILLLPSRAVCMFAASRSHNYILNPPSILDWNSFANNFVHVNWQKFLADFRICFGNSSSNGADISALISDLIGLHPGSVSRWCLPPGVWCRRKMSGTGASSAVSPTVPVLITNYLELMNAIREPTLQIWIEEAASLTKRLQRVNSKTHMSATWSASLLASTTASLNNNLANNNVRDDGDDFDRKSTTNSGKNNNTNNNNNNELLINCIPIMFERAEYEIKDFDFPSYLMTAEQKSDKCPMRWWPSVRHASTKMKNYSILEIRHPSLRHRLTMSKIAATLEFMKRKSEIPEASINNNNNHKNNNNNNNNYNIFLDDNNSNSNNNNNTNHHHVDYLLNSSPSFTPGLSWDQLFQPVLGLGVAYDSTKDFGINRFILVQPHNPTLHEKLMRDYHNPANSIFENEIVFTRRKREILRIAIALRQLHEYGLFHGDIRPDNIFVEEDVGGGDYANARTRYRLGNMVLVPELVVAALMSPRPLKRKIANNHNILQTSSPSSKKQQSESNANNESNNNNNNNSTPQTTLEEDEDAKWGYAAPELLRYLAHGGTVSHASPSDMDKETLTPLSLARCDMFSLGVLLLAVFSGGYDHPFTNLLERVDMEEEKTQIEAEFAKKIEDLAVAAYLREQHQHANESSTTKMTNNKIGETSFNNRSIVPAKIINGEENHDGDGDGDGTSTHPDDDDSDEEEKENKKKIRADAALRARLVKRYQDDAGPMTAAELKSIATEKAAVLEKRLLCAQARSAYQIVNRAAESPDRLFMLGSLKWLRFSIFNHLERERVEPTNAEALAQKRREAKEDQDILDRKTGDGVSGAQSFAFAIKRLVSRGRRGGAFKLSSDAAEADKAITGLLLIDLVSKLIVADPTKRITAAEVCNHPFFADVMISSSSSLPIPSTACTVEIQNAPMSSSSANASSTNPSGVVASASAIHHTNSNNNNSNLMFSASTANLILEDTKVTTFLTPAGGSDDSAVQLRNFLRSAEQALLKLRGGKDGATSSASYFGSASGVNQRQIRWTISLDDAFTELPPTRREAAPSRKSTSSNNNENGENGDLLSNNNAASNFFERKNDLRANSSEADFGKGNKSNTASRMNISMSDDDEDDDSDSSSVEDEDDDNNNNNNNFNDDHQEDNESQDGTSNNNKRSKRKSSQNNNNNGDALIEGISERRRRAMKKANRPLHFDVRIAPASSETMWRAWKQQRRSAKAMLETKMEPLLRRAYDLREFVTETSF